MSEKVYVYHDPKDDCVTVTYISGNYQRTIRIKTPCEYYYHKPEIPHMIELGGVDGEYQQLYYMEFTSKGVALIFETDGEILDFSEDFVAYVPRQEDEEEEKNSQHITVIRNLNTKEDYIIPIDPLKFERTFKIERTKAGSEYIVLYGGVAESPFRGYQGPFFIYNIEQKQIIHQDMNEDSKNVLHVSSNFLDGIIPFYYIERPTPYGFGVCSIYNKGKLLSEVKCYYADIITKLETMLEYNFLITKDTRYVSDVDNEKGLIRFYKLREDSLELVNTLQINKHEYWFYVTHLFSCGNKFMICEKARYSENYGKIFLYNVSKEKIEYESEYYSNTPCHFEIGKDAEINKEFIENLLLYAHGYQDYFYHITKNCIDNKVIFEKIQKSKQLESSKLKV